MNTNIPPQIRNRSNWFFLRTLATSGTRIVQKLRLHGLLVVLTLYGISTQSAFAQTNTVEFGQASDLFVPADYDGDGKTDIAVWRPGAAGVAAFRILRSSNQATEIRVFGQSGDDPTIVGDYDGDGKADPALFRGGETPGATNTWMYLSSAAGYSPVSVTWGQSGDFPSPGDYNGDGRYDFVVQRSVGGGNASFFMLFSGGGMETNAFGLSSYSIVPGDYDGDGKTDLATIHPSGGNIIWDIKLRTGAIQTVQFGNSSTDYAVQGDYNGDGKTDVAVWRAPGTFFVHFSTGSNPPTTPASIDLQFPLGQNGDYAVANFNSH